MLEQINQDITKAMKSGEKFELSVLRMLKAELKNAEINKKDVLTDDEVVAIVKKQVKVRKDSKAEYESYNRDDLASGLENEINILSKYLPEELSEEEIGKIIDETIRETGASNIKSMGMVIKAIQERCGSAVDMGLVSRLVKEKLN